MIGLKRIVILRPIKFNNESSSFFVFLYYHDDELFIEKCSLRKIAETSSTPCYVYSKAKLEKNWQIRRRETIEEMIAAEN